MRDARPFVSDAADPVEFDDIFLDGWKRLERVLLLGQGVEHGSNLAIAVFVGHVQSAVVEAHMHLHEPLDNLRIGVAEFLAVLDKLLFYLFPALFGLFGGACATQGDRNDNGGDAHHTDNLTVTDHKVILLHIIDLYNILC